MPAPEPEVAVSILTALAIPRTMRGAADIMAPIVAVSVSASRPKEGPISEAPAALAVSLAGSSVSGGRRAS